MRILISICIYWSHPLSLGANEMNLNLNLYAYMYSIARETSAAARAPVRSRNSIIIVESSFLPRMRPQKA